MESLSYILRPKTTKNIVGQTHLLYKNGIIPKMIEKQFPTNLIFYGPPGVGKTTTAIALANDLGLRYEQFNAAKDKKEKLQKIISLNQEQRLILIVDEIHRMNRNTQDFLLEYLETKEVLIFITTTENPYFVINPAIRSRCTILQLKEISQVEMFAGIKNIIKTNDLALKIADDTLNQLCSLAGGDLRIALNALELLINLYAGQTITEDILTNIFDRAASRGSGVGDEHYDLMSALQKSIRGSDVHATLYYWARLLENGDHEALMRRMLVIAYEDIGLANPTIGPRVFQACQVFRQVGMPEGRIVLGLAVIEMALSEKSNSAYMAIDKVLSDVRSGVVHGIPKHLRDSHYKSAAKLGAGIGYNYPHNFENAWIAQQYLPNEIKTKKYFEFKPHSAYEKKLMQMYNKFTKKQEGER